VILKARCAWVCACGCGRGRGLQLPEGMSGDGAAFLRACFTVDPAARPSARTLIHHDWLAHLSRSLPAAAFDSDPVGPLGPGPPLAADAAAADDGAAGGRGSPAEELEAEAEAGGRGAAPLPSHAGPPPALRSSMSTPCLQQAGSEAGWAGD
jgi:hypothetical protein